MYFARAILSKNKCAHTLPRVPRGYSPTMLTPPPPPPHRPLALVASTLAAASASNLTAASAPADAAAAPYAYTPPVRTSAERAAAAVRAALPRVRVAPAIAPRVVFVLGGPGAGKGTQCARLVEDYGFVHLSAGDLLREERARGGPAAEMIEATIRDGRIVPVEVTVALLRDAMAASGASKFLVDGFPRNFDNLAGWQRVVGDAARVEAVLQYEAPEDVLVARLLERGKTSGRSDDNEESIRKRLRTYAESTLPVVEHYAARPGVVHVIAGDRPVAAVYEDTKRAVAGAVASEVLALSQVLLDAISAGDWAAYAALCAPDMTCFEPEHPEGVVRGLAFHAAAFEAGAKTRAAAALAGAPVRWTASTMHEPQVRLLGPRAALVTYVRHVAPLAGAGGDATVKRVAETRVWSAESGRWLLTHLHRSPMPPLA